MENEPHPFYAGLSRWIKDHRKQWSISSFSAELGSNSTIRKAMQAGSAPSEKTVTRAEQLTGLTKQEIIDWPNVGSDATSADDLETRLELAFSRLPTTSLRRKAVSILETLAGESDAETRDLRSETAQ